MPRPALQRGAFLWGAEQALRQLLSFWRLSGGGLGYTGLRGAGKKTVLFPLCMVYCIQNAPPPVGVEREIRRKVPGLALDILIYGRDANMQRTTAAGLTYPTAIQGRKERWGMPILPRAEKRDRDGPGVFVPVSACCQYIRKNVKASMFYRIKE